NRCSSKPISPTDIMEGTIAPARRRPSRRLIQIEVARLGASARVVKPSRTAAFRRLLFTSTSGEGVEPSKYSSGMVRNGGISTVIAGTAKVTTSVMKKKVVHMCIKSKDLAKMTINAAETVEIQLPRLLLRARY